jgi:hypothetical protein
VNGARITLIGLLIPITTALGFGCSGESSDVNWLTPAASRATLLFAADSIAIGEIGVVELAVVTAPDHQVRPFRAPDTLDGFWLLDAEPSRIERQSTRWIHRTRIRIRAREVGNFEWPEGSIEVEAPDGSVVPVTFGALPLEVGSVIADPPQRDAPYGARAPPAPPRAAALALAAASGALGTLVSLGAIALVRHHTRRRGIAVDASEPRSFAPPWVEAREALAGARAIAESNPRRAADDAAVALRRYTAKRFGTDTDTRTTEELESAPAPFAAASRWPHLLEILRALDALRFPPSKGEHDPLRSQDVVHWATEVEKFVTDSIPQNHSDRLK